jgi:predicted MFS family arabinose efflux permease
MPRNPRRRDLHVQAWSFYPAQQARLLAAAGTKVGSVALSLNASFMFAGFASGAALGSATIAHGSPADLGWVGAACIVAALGLAYLLSRESEVRAGALVQY